MPNTGSTGASAALSVLLFDVLLSESVESLSRRLIPLAKLAFAEAWNLGCESCPAAALSSEPSATSALPDAVKPDEVRLTTRRLGWSSEDLWLIPERNEPLPADEAANSTSLGPDETAAGSASAEAFSAPASAL